MLLTASKNLAPADASVSNDPPLQRIEATLRRGESNSLSKFQLRFLLRFALLASEIAAIILCYGVASYIRLGSDALPSLLTLMSVTLPVYVGTALNTKAFDLQSIRTFSVSAKRALLSFLFTIGTVSLMVFFLKASADFSRLIFGLGTALCIPTLLVLRYSVIRLTRRIAGSNPFSELIIQDGVTLPDTGDVMVIDAGAHGIHPCPRDPHNIQRLGEFVRNIDKIVVACRQEDRARWSFVLKALDIDAEMYVQELDDLGAVGMGNLGDKRTMIISAGPLPLRHRVMKRCFDIALVLTVAPLFALPMILVAFAIKLESPGPVLFRQVRIGRGNRPFYILKFRSMRVELCDTNGNRSAARDDDRITKVGAFIRKTSIDELPQILNVLLGDMSIVGPRPHAVGSRAENLLFWDIDDRYWHRHAVKPGLTGLAQIRGFRGATEVRADLSNRLQADLEYRANWSLWRDISIILATFKVLVHRNAF